MEDFVPIGFAAQKADYSYSSVQKMAKNKKVPVREIYGRPYVDLNAVLAYRERMQALGTAKHTPRRYRDVPIAVDQEVPDAQP